MEKTQNELDHDLIWKVVNGVQPYVPGSLLWIAKQDDDERDDVWGFVIGKGFAHVTVERAKAADDALYRELATQIMGFAPDSPQDIARKRKEAQEIIDGYTVEIAYATRNRDYWQRQLAALPPVAEPAVNDGNDVSG